MPSGPANRRAAEAQLRMQCIPFKQLGEDLGSRGPRKPCTAFQPCGSRHSQWRPSPCFDLARMKLASIGDLKAASGSQAFFFQYSNAGPVITPRPARAPPMNDRLFMEPSRFLDSSTWWWESFVSRLHPAAQTGMWTENTRSVAQRPVILSMFSG